MLKTWLKHWIIWRLSVSEEGEDNGTIAPCIPNGNMVLLKLSQPKDSSVYLQPSKFPATWKASIRWSAPTQWILSKQGLFFQFPSPSKQSSQVPRNVDYFATPTHVSYIFFPNQERYMNERLPGGNVLGGFSIFRPYCFSSMVLNTRLDPPILI